MFKFLCANDDDHVNGIDVKAEDAQGALEFFDHFGIPLANRDVLESAIASGDVAQIHDACHSVILEGILTAHDNADPAMVEMASMVPEFIESIREKQAKCRLGVHKETL